MTYADLADIARREWLAPLAALPRRAPPDGMEPIYRPLGGTLLVRWLQRPDLDLSECDALALGAAHTMLAAWIRASEGDTTELPFDSPRAALIAEIARYWG